MQNCAEKIAGIYRDEQEKKPRALTLNDVPGIYEAITAQWLTAVLCRDTPGAEVTSFSIGDRSDGSSNRARIYLTYNEAGQRVAIPARVRDRLADRHLFNARAGLLVWSDQPLFAFSAGCHRRIAVTKLHHRITAIDRHRNAGDQRCRIG